MLLHGIWNTQGYTTLAETWLLSSQSHDASIDHMFMGDISVWITNMLAGINYDVAKPGFENVIIKPHFVKDLDWVQGKYNSV